MTVNGPGLHFTDEELESILDAAHRQSDRRVESRYAVFIKVTLRAKQAPFTSVSTFSRELAASGIGLLHTVPLRAGDCYDADIRVNERCISKEVRVAWCTPMDDGWFVSGCVFV
jgi:hypothetical protein